MSADHLVSNGHVDDRMDRRKRGNLRMMFNALRAWFDRREVMRELAAQRRIALDSEEMHFKERLERAEAAMAADQRATALRLCSEIRERFYQHACGSAGLLKIMLDLRRYDEVEQMMNDGFARYPRARFFIVGRARVAEQRGDIEVALERWREVRKKFPGLALGYARSAACLVEAGRMQEADAMLARGIRQAPEDVFCLIEHAKLAEAAGNFEQALSRWQHLIDVPSEQHIFRQNGCVGLAQCLRKMGRLDEAEAVLLPFVERFGVQEAPLMELALIAEQRDDWAEALTRYQRVRSKFPMFHEGYRGVIKALEHAGRTSDVDLVLRDLMDRFPGDLWPALEYARNAYGPADKSEISRRWALVREQFPGCEAAYRDGAQALSALGQEDAAAAIWAEHKARFAA